MVGMSDRDEAIRHFKALQSRYIRQRNGRACRYVVLALEALYAMDSNSRLTADLAAMKARCETAVSQIQRDCDTCMRTPAECKQCALRKVLRNLTEEPTGKYGCGFQAASLQKRGSKP